MKQIAAVILVAVVVASGCLTVRDMKPGTVIPVAELYEARANLRGIIARELAAERTSRAFYVLEVEKTRAYAAQQIAARSARHHSVLARSVRDLRPVFAALYDPQVAAVPQRGLRLDSAAAPPDNALDFDRLYWRDLSLREARFATQVPYGEVARGHVGALSAEEARLLFGRDEAYLSYAVIGDRIHGFLLYRGSLVARPLEVTHQRLGTQIAELVAQLRDPPVVGSENQWRSRANAVRAALFDKFPELTKSNLHTLYISPDGPIGAVPFAALLEQVAGRERLLLERLRVALLPSATVYRKALETSLTDALPRLLAVGNPHYPTGVVDLPFADREAATVSRVFQRGMLLHGADATESNVGEAVADHNILHFATHGVLLGRSRPGSSSLLVTPDERHDGFLSAAEIAMFDLSHVNLVVLSACESSVADRPERQTDLASLTGAFLIAGAPSVIGSLWMVDDEATTLLMLRFYERFLDAGAGEAMRTAQLAMSRSRAHAHPYFWAAFVLYGWDK